MTHAWLQLASPFALAFCTAQRLVCRSLLVSSSVQLHLHIRLSIKSSFTISPVTALYA